MDFASNLSYQVDILCSVVENAEYECAMREAAFLETGLYDSYSVKIIHEAFVDKIKSFFETLPGLITNAMQKFIDLFNVKYQKAKGYIEKYGEYIDKECKLENINVYTYNTSNIKDAAMPSINFESMKEKFDDLLTAQKALFPTFATDDAAKFVDNIKKVLRGNPETEDKPSIKGKDFDMGGAKEYLLNFTIIRRNIEKDKRSLLSQLNIFKNIIKTKQNEAAANNVGEKNEAFYSALYNKTLLLEADDASNNDSGNDNKSSTDTSKPAESEKDKSADNILKSAASKVKDGASELATTFKRIRTATSVCTKYFSARMVIANECFDEYFRIIQEHVKSYNAEASENGSDDASKDKENTEEKTENSNEELTADESEKVKDVVKDAMNNDGTVKNMDDTGKAKLFSKLKSAANGKENAITKIFSKITSKMKKG